MGWYMLTLLGTCWKTYNYELVPRTACVKVVWVSFSLMSYLGLSSGVLWWVVPSVTSVRRVSRTLGALAVLAGRPLGGSWLRAGTLLGWGSWLTPRSSALSRLYARWDLSPLGFKALGIPVPLEPVEPRRNRLHQLKGRLSLGPGKAITQRGQSRWRSRRLLRLIARRSLRSLLADPARLPRATQHLGPLSRTYLRCPGALRARPSAAFRKRTQAKRRWRRRRKRRTKTGETGEETGLAGIISAFTALLTTQTSLFIGGCPPITGIPQIGLAT